MCRNSRISTILGYGVPQSTFQQEDDETAVFLFFFMVNRVTFSVSAICLSAWVSMGFDARNTERPVVRTRETSSTLGRFYDASALDVFSSKTFAGRPPQLPALGTLRGCKLIRAE